MAHRSNSRKEPAFLGIECGATHSVALAVNANDRVLAKMESGPGNLRLMSDAQMRGHFRQIAAALPTPVSLAIGMAGARNAVDFQRIRRAADKVWPRVPCYATNDLETALMASGPLEKTTVLILSGTGSCVFGKTPEGQSAKIGGWGHILGDKGSAFEIALRALKAVVYYFDRDGQWPALGSRLLRAAMLNQPDDLIGWVRDAQKPEIAALAIEVFNAARQRDRIATDILNAAAHGLASDAAACASKLTTPKSAVAFLFSGSVLTKQPSFADAVKLELQGLWPHCTITALERESVWGAVFLAHGKNVHPSSELPEQEVAAPIAATPSLDSLKNSSTEQRNPRSMRLHRMSVSEAIDLMISEDASIALALQEQSSAIEKAVRMIVRSLKAGGRLFYVGAGTSGRLGVLDASECPPTFQTEPDLVQGIIAGGQAALWRAVEGAEDDPAKGADAIRFRGVTDHDVVVGIAASGRTPFVWGALAQARAAGAKTILLCFNPFIEVPSSNRPDLIVAPNVGPEILTGSTRLKAGTATKLILNIFTTLAMVQLGKVYENLMIDVKASNSKLRDRAIRILQAVTNKDYESCRGALEKTGWKIRLASARLGKR